MISDCPEDRYTAKPFPLERRMIFKRERKLGASRRTPKKLRCCFKRAIFKSHPHGSDFCEKRRYICGDQRAALLSILNGEFQNSLCHPVNLSILSLLSSDSIKRAGRFVERRSSRSRSLPHPSFLLLLQVMIRR